tara:strand:- start:970 stop:1608 length:639 start_codon:yes stop_codon:yes gene_type:complete
VEGYSQSVINLFNELRGKRKLVDIVNLLEDLTEYYINKHEVPIQILLNDLDICIENNMFKGFTTVEIKKIYKIVNKFDSVYTKIPSTSDGMSISDKMANIIQNISGSSTRESDQFLVKLRRQLSLRIEQSPININITEEYSDELNAHYIRLFKSNKEREFAIIVMQDNLVMYYSLLTNRQYPINLKTNKGGLKTLISVFVENDIDFIENSED